MISEASCDTKDCSNDAEKTAVHPRNKLHFKIYYIENSNFKFKTSYNITILLYFYKKNANLANIRDFLQFFLLNCSE